MMEARPAGKGGAARNCDQSLPSPRISSIGGAPIPEGIPLLKTALHPTLLHPFAEPPELGQTIEVAPGILWTRLSLPFRLDHVNIYLIDDGDGWAVLDTGLGSNKTRAMWEALAAGPLAGRRLTRLIVTHFHPDHIGLAGWMCERFDMPMLTSQTAWLGCINISLNPDALTAQHYRDFYMAHGMDDATTSVVMTQGHGYLRMVSPLPPTFRRIVAGDVLKIGGREFEVMTGDGHAPEQVMLWCAAEEIFLAADQVLAKITPNVSVWAVDPQGDPLGLYLRSLKSLKARLPEDAFVLPGHQLPFRGLHTRCDELAAHHAARCELIAAACAARPHSVAELVPVMFTRQLDPHQLSFAFSEVHAHVNYMVERGELGWVREGGVMRVRGL
jgi:glyoxylase-like metal-dependent hydrolase (beta-lactamase superfamily II)